MRARQTSHSVVIKTGTGPWTIIGWMGVGCLGFLGILAVLFVLIVIGASSARAQNILVLQADDLGTDLVGCYGGAASTPNIDALAMGGLRFDRAYANPTCSPTRATILTGQYAFRSGIGTAIGRRDPYGLDPRPATLLPKALPSSYLKVAIGKWHLGTPETGGEWHPVLCGFDLYVGALENLGDYWNFQKTYASPSGVATVPWSGYATEDEASDAIMALQVLRSSGRPWFLYVNFHAIHQPWHYPPGYSGQPSLTGGPECRAMTAYLDTQIGRILSAVDLGTTTVIFTGDNGTIDGVVPASPLRAGKHSVYEGGVRVPLVIGGNTIGGSTGTAPDLVQSVDLYATVLDLAGARIPQACDSIPLTPILWGRAGWRAIAFVERFGPNGLSTPTSVQKAATDARYKLVIGEAPAPQFFDLGLDPGESNPLDLATLNLPQAASYQALAAALAALGR